MYAVGRLGNYISRGVHTVSGPFHRFSGAVDIIVVEQQDGTFKSSPWYVRFGKFQGVPKTKEEVVNISVNGVQADFHMYLDHKGETYFLSEVDVEEGNSVFYPPFSDEQSRSSTSPLKSKSFHYDANQSDLVTHIDATNVKILTRKSSCRSRIFGLVFGRKSMKEDTSQEQETGPGVVRADSLERAKLVANLLEVNWSTNLACTKRRKTNVSRLSAPDIPGGEANNDLPIKVRQGETDSPLQDNMVHSLDYHVLHEGISSYDSKMGNSYQKLGSSDKDFGVEISHLNTKHIVETSSFGESGLHENYSLNSQTVRKIDQLGGMNVDHDENARGFISKTISPDPDPAQLSACPSTKLDEQVFKEKDIVLPGDGVSKEERGEDRLEAFVYCETLENSKVGGLEDLYAKTLHQTAELISEVTSLQETSLLVANGGRPLDVPDLLADGICDNEAQILGSEGTSLNTIANRIVSETCTPLVTVDPIYGSVKKDELCSICTISDFNKSIYEVQDEQNIRDGDNISNFQYSSKPISESQAFRGDSFTTKVMTVSPSDISEEEQLLFGDLDDFNHGEVKCIESISSVHVEQEDHPSVAPNVSEAVIESLNPNDELHSSPDKFVQENMPNDVEDFRQKSRTVSTFINIPRSNKVAGEDVERMAESLPSRWSHMDVLDVDDPLCSLGHSLDSNSESLKWMLLRGDISSCIKSDEDKDLVSQAQPTVKDAQISQEPKEVPASPAVASPLVGEYLFTHPVASLSLSMHGEEGNPSKAIDTSQPTHSSTSSDGENTLESSIGLDGERDVLVKKKKVRAVTPTSEQLASLNLNKGKNTVTFTFSTAMLGPQQVDARIFSWKWDTRVVISDIDGTITKSDVLGQFMPWVGVDWSQTGVAHLFSDIKENGYQLLFLSARAISQAYHTRQFLFNLKQDGKAIPDGPVVISPDGLFPSLFREVIRRAPHEFKIACLEDIRALFPPDCNPFYAGFGNRDTDEISYLKVGIPKGKIFIINSKGQVVVNHHVDSKSYTSLHTLVHYMFPPMSSSEQEDFNSWNYWKLPPAIDA
ncbi:phosphatidate phosphatase PAH2-like isoform X1 [Camellia sinensis]|uniref:phosphatidate phosphatase PAH2-like isoform X1 n=1 Tax=Camellia sinensis TaxID=4442 RepID=UPI0010361BE9|nr:phosphatidate phosphatase PAH2-like isoform X1 [Camellia sinensis]